MEDFDLLMADHGKVDEKFGRVASTISCIVLFSGRRAIGSIFASSLRACGLNKFRTIITNDLIVGVLSMFPPQM